MLAFTLILVIFASSVWAQASKEFNPGTYTGSAQGKNGMVTVEVTVDSSSILSVVVKEQHETDGISANALLTVPQEIVAQQSLKVDTVSNIEATSVALMKARGDVEKLKMGSVAGMAKAISVAMKPGVYYGEAYGKWPKGSNEGGRFLSPKVIKSIRVEVTVDATSIKSVKVLSCDDTPGFKESAITQIPAAIVKYQSVGVDAVTLVLR